MNTLTDLLLGVGQPRVSHFPDLCTLLYTYLSTLDYWTKIVYYLFTQTSPVAHTSALTPTYIKSQKLPNWPISKELGLGRMLLPHWKLLLDNLSHWFISVNLRNFENNAHFRCPLQSTECDVLLLWISHQPFLTSHVWLQYSLLNRYSTDDVMVNLQISKSLPMIIRNDW